MYFLSNEHKLSLSPTDDASDDTFIFPAVKLGKLKKLLIKAHITVTHCGENKR